MWTPTNTIDLQVDSRTHDLVPPENVVNQQTTVVEAARSTEGMREGGILAEVLVDGLSLLRRRRLGQTVDDVADFLYWVIHDDRI